MLLLQMWKIRYQSPYRSAKTALVGRQPMAAAVDGDLMEPQVMGLPAPDSLRLVVKDSVQAEITKKTILKGQVEDLSMLLVPLIAYWMK